MKERILAGRYARALFELSKEAGRRARETESELGEFLRLTKENKTLGLFFKNPMIPSEDKKQVLAELAHQGVGGHSPLLERFLTLLMVKGRFGLLETILEIFHELANTEERVEEVAVTTARTLGRATEVLLEKTLAKRMGMKVVLQKKIDPGLLGGIRLEVRHRLLDESIRTKLDHFKRELMD